MREKKADPWLGPPVWSLHPSQVFAGFLRGLWFPPAWAVGEAPAALSWNKWVVKELPYLFLNISEMYV